ncbi:MAG: hypothetical protein KAJ10_14920 [Thermodesulfovibrionia bacterium]|nr:hypothetical protein [Thermodesulfovibrionia bacterium]
MALPIIFSLSTVLIFINIEPFRVTGVFLSVCYLPGFTLLALCKKNGISFKDLILAFPFSIGVSCVLTLILLLLGINVKYVSLVIQVVVGIVLIVSQIAKKKNRILKPVELTKQERCFLFFALTITIVLSIPFYFGINRLSIAGHAYHHSLLVTQIVNGIFPPENPGLGATTIGYYWGFHTLIAAITAQTNFHPLQIIFIINMVSLFAIFCIAYIFAKTFDLPEMCCYIMPLAILGLMRLDAGVFVLVKFFSGNLIPIKEISPSWLEPSEVLRSWLKGLPWVETRLFFLRKFYNVSGMPLAICLCFTYLLLLLDLIKGNTDNKVYLAGIGITIFACVFNYPPLAVFILLHVHLWTCFVFLLTNGDFMEKFREVRKIILPYIIAMLFVSPYMLFVIKSRAISSSGQGGLFSFDFYYQSLNNMIVFLLPLPVIIYGIWRAFQVMYFSKEAAFLFVGMVLSLILAVVTRWPFDNSYKFNYILIFFFAFYFTFALSVWLPCVAARLTNRFFAGIVVIMLLLAPFMIEAAHISASLSTDYKVIFHEKHLWYAKDHEKNEAYSWIRNNTAPNALIMLSYIETTWPCCGMNDNYEHAAIAERNLYLINDRDYTASNPEYKMRVNYRNKLFENPKDPETVNFFKLLNRPVYLLLEKDLPDYFLVEDRFKSFPVPLDKTFELKFHSDRQQVYFVNVK